MTATDPQIAIAVAMAVWAIVTAAAIARLLSNDRL